jgi:hypothetical protein
MKRIWQDRVCIWAIKSVVVNYHYAVALLFFIIAEASWLSDLLIAYSYVMSIVHIFISRNPCAFVRISKQSVTNISSSLILL